MLVDRCTLVKIILFKSEIIKITADTIWAFHHGRSTQLSEHQQISYCKFYGLLYAIRPAKQKLGYTMLCKCLFLIC